MGMSISRWVTIVGAICAAVSAVLLPFPAAPPLAWIPAPTTSPALDAEMHELTQAAAVAQSAVRTYRHAARPLRCRSATRAQPDGHALGVHDRRVARAPRPAAVAHACNVRHVDGTVPVAERWASQAGPRWLRQLR